MMDQCPVPIAENAPAHFRLGGMLVLILVILFPVQRVAAETTEQAVKRVLEDKSIQSELPGKPKAQAPRISNRQRTEGSGFGTFGQILLWGLVIAAAGMLIFFIAREFAGMRRRSGREEIGGGAGAGGALSKAEPAMPEDLLAEADRLAARGAFSEAVHLILIHSLRRLDAVSSAAFGRSLTAREIVSRAGLGEQARRWFSYIVSASELVHFGGRPADASAYKKCRDAFERLAGETTQL